MPEIDTASATYDRILEENDGKTSHEIADKLEREKEYVDAMRSEVAAETATALESTGGSDVTDQREDTQSAVAEVLDEQGSDIGEEQLAATSKKLDEGAKNLKVVDSVTMRKELEPGVAAHAMQETAGSTEFSGQAVKGDNGIPDEVKMKAYKAHEVDGHENQKSADVAAVTIEKKDGSEHTVTAQAFGELDAIEKQLHEEPSTEADLVPQYRGEFHDDILALGLDRSETERLAYNGQLSEFARRVAEKNGTQYSLSS